ncbi:nuclear transport factor 2 family protein, partial [Pseudonocardia sp. KRD-188]
PEVADPADLADPVEPAPVDVDAAEPDAEPGPADLEKSAPRGRRRAARDEPAEATEPAETASWGRGRALLARLRTVPVLAAALVVLVALAVFFGIATASLRGNPAAANTALTDLAATSEVSTQLGDALETLYSYDFSRLDENERAARGVITDAFAPEFDRLFAQVRELAPQQEAVVSAVVNVSAVQRIDGDTAVLVAFMDQQATTAASAEQVAAAGRLTVTGERVDGRWRIAAVESR